MPRRRGAPAWFLGALALWGASTACRAEVAITIRVPARPVPEILARLRASEEDIGLLLPAPARRIDHRAPEASMTVRFESPGWSAGLTPERRNALLKGLAAAWGANLSVEENGKRRDAGLLASTPAPAAARPVPRASLDRRLGQLERLAAGDFLRTYDGGRGGAGAPLVPAAPAPSSLKSSELGRLAVPVAELSPAPQADPEHARAIQEAAARSGVDPAVLKAVVAAKSDFQADHRGQDAYGLMGISAGLARAYGRTKEDLFDPAANLAIGADLLARLIRQFDGDLSRALAAYQVGPKAVLDSEGIPSHPQVRRFLADFQLAYRSGPDKPRVYAVAAPEPAPGKRLRSALQAKALEAAAGAACVDKPVSAYRRIIEDVGAQVGVDPKLMEAMVMKENPWGNPCKRNDRSGATGLGQLMPETAAALGVKDSTNPRQNLAGMARHFKWLLEYFEGDKVLAVAAYNAGHVPVEKVNRVPRISETMRYTRDVFIHYESLGGDSIDVAPYMPPPAPVRKPKPT